MLSKIICEDKQLLLWKLTIKSKLPHGERGLAGISSGCLSSLFVALSVYANCTDLPTIKGYCAQSTGVQFEPKQNQTRIELLKEQQKCS